MQSNPQPAPLPTLTLADLRAVSGGATTTADAASVTASVLMPDPPNKPPPK